MSMRFLSTRGGQDCGIVEAIMQGLADDGGLFVPESLQPVAVDEIRGETLAEIAEQLLSPYFAGSSLSDQLGDLCRDALNFPLPLRQLAPPPDSLSVLELFHGPTAAFKDVGARFLAAVMERHLLAQQAGTGDGRPLTILVATSGDTGAAVAAAFHRRPGFRVAVLFPRGQVSPRQAHQLTCWGDNVRSFEIDGSFDDCQKLVKAAFTHPVLNRRHRLSAANSINLGRLLPQTAYHAAAAVWHWREQGQPLNFIVPSGNLGNGLACVWARAMGLPIGRIVLAVNANKTIPDFLSTGEYRPRGSVATLASAMDVGAPSNMERLRHLIPDFADLRAVVDAVPVSDDQIRQAIALGYRRYEEVWCPHTATGFWVYDRMAPGLRREHAWVVLATAHPAKFETIVEPIIGRAVAMPAALAKMLEQPAKSMALAAELSALAAELDRW